MNDVLDGLQAMSRAFGRARLKRPTAILLESHEEGMRFLEAVQRPSDRVVEMADGSAWMECKVAGIAVRWPANRAATPDGNWSYV